MSYLTTFTHKNSSPSFQFDPVVEVLQREYVFENGVARSVTKLVNLNLGDNKENLTIHDFGLNNLIATGAVSQLGSVQMNQNNVDSVLQSLENSVQNAKQV